MRVWMKTLVILVVVVVVVGPIGVATATTATAASRRPRPFPVGRRRPLRRGFLLGAVQTRAAARGDDAVGVVVNGGVETDLLETTDDAGGDARARCALGVADVVLNATL